MRRLVHRRLIPAQLSAASAVSCGIDLNEFLEARLKTYCATKPSSDYPLPVKVSIVANDIHVEEDDRALEEFWNWRRDADSSDTAGPSFAPRIFAIESGRAVRLLEVSRLEEERGRLSVDLNSHREVLRKQRAEEQEAILTGNALVKRTLARSRRSRGWPLLPAGLERFGTALVYALGIAAEGGLFLFPILNLSGIDVTRLATEWQRDPVVILVCGATSALAALAMTRLASRIVTLSEQPTFGAAAFDLRDVVRSAVYIVPFGLLAAWTGWIRAAQLGSPLEGDDTASASSGSAWIVIGFALLAIVVPLVLAELEQRLRAFRNERRAAREGRRQWLAEENALHLNTERREEVIHRLGQREARIEEQQDSVMDELSDLAAAEDAIRAQYVAKVDAERDLRHAWTNQLVACLARDRLAYRRAQGRLVSREKRRVRRAAILQRLRRRFALPATAALIIILCILLSGCSAAQAHVEGPLRTEVVCESEDGAACSSRVLAPFIEEWARQALVRPFSTFTVWRASDGKTPAHASLKACVPSTWGVDVQGRKRRFLLSTRTGIDRAVAQGGDTGITIGTCPSASAEVEASSVYIVGRAATPQSSQLENSATKAKGGLPTHMAVVCDRSDSTFGACDSESLAAAMHRWLVASALIEHSTFTVYLVGHSRDTTKSLFVAVIDGLTPGERVAMALGDLRRVTALFQDDASPANASALVEALDVAVTDLHDRTGHYEIELHSDGRQVTPEGPWNLEQSVPDARQFVEQLHSRGLSPDLTGIPIILCGVHHQRQASAPPVDAASAARLRALWTTALGSMGANVVHVTHSCSAM